MDLKNTLNLPKTDFPMKAKLPEREPRQLAAWEEMGLYRRILESRTGAPLFVLQATNQHDLPRSCDRVDSERLFSGTHSESVEATCSRWG